MSDEEGNISIILNDSVLIDEFYYTNDMHFALLDEEDGVSLERINFDNPTQDPNNWHSASEQVGFATPGYENSQFKENADMQNENISIEPKIFSPDNDGLDDYASIYYKFDEPGNVANVTVFDGKGRLVKKLSQNSLLGTEGIITWDGLNENKLKSQIGIYIIYFEVFNLNGNVEFYKKTVVLSAKF